MSAAPSIQPASS